MAFFRLYLEFETFDCVSELSSGKKLFFLDPPFLLGLVLGFISN
jgi:hypothetical protein